MRIYVAGNILVEEDSLPLKILPKLRKKFSGVEFIEIDPNENFLPAIDKPLYILDTAEGIKEITVFCGLDSFSKHKPVSLHDYDLLFHLRLLEKLNKLPKEIYIIGIPKFVSQKAARAGLSKTLKRLKFV